MKITKGSIAIIDIPLFDSITIKEDGRIEVSLSALDGPFLFSVEEIIELRNALNQAITFSMERNPPTESIIADLGRVWNIGDPEPDDVTRVIDYESDTWIKDEDSGRWQYGTTLTRSWENLLEEYGSLTEAGSS